MGEVKGDFGRCDSCQYVESFGSDDSHWGCVSI